jgi:DNA-binding GntR family transcriptional regulator
MGEGELEAAVGQMRTDIRTGRLVPGQRLVETDMMMHLGVSRGHVREVFRRLRAEGFIEIERNRGASVRKISRLEVVSAMEVLEAITLLIIRRVASQADQPTIAAGLTESLAIARRFRRESARIPRVHDYMDENARFWGSLSTAAGNPILSDIRERLQGLLFRFAMEDLTISNSRDKWLSSHEEIIVALLDGKRALAVRCAKKSIHNVREAILSLPDEAFGS